MPIIGMTDQAARLPIVGILRKGEEKKDENRPGKDLTFFRFVTDDNLAEKMFNDAYPDQEALRNINVFLPFKTAEENFDAWIEKWVASSLVYRSDGETVVLHRTEAGAFSNEPKADPKPGESEDGKRKDGSSYVGRLSVIIPELGRLVTVTVLTTSKWDNINLSRTLKMYEAMTGDLRGIPFTLRRRPHKISTPAGNGKRARREKWLLSIETLPRWTIAKLTAMERAALPEAEIMDEPDYSIPGLPANVIDPYGDYEESPENEQVEQPKPKPEPPKTNGKATRPLDPATLREFLHKKRGDDDNEKATPAQIGLLASKLDECFAPDSDRGKRIRVLDWLWGEGGMIVTSTNDLTKAQAKATLDWLLTGNQDDTGDYPLHPAAPEEARRVWRQVQQDSGQVDMFGEQAA